MDSIPATSIEGTINPSFTDRNRLLFHYFMDGYTILFQHLIELIDTDNTTIGQDHGSSFNTALSCVLITHNGGRQTYYSGQKEGLIPTPDEPLPVVFTAKGAVFKTKRKNWDLPQEGSPT